MSPFQRFSGELGRLTEFAQWGEGKFLAMPYGYD